MEKKSSNMGYGFALFATNTTHILDSLVIPSAERERDIQRHADAQHREEVLLKIEAELKLKEQEVIKTEAEARIEGSSEGRRWKRIGHRLR